jgi:hypothetical protein
MIELRIVETGRGSLKEEPLTFNEEVVELPDIQAVKEALIDRYGHIPKGKRKVYIDDLDGKAKEIGFLHSFWNRDISHNSKPWYQTDWVSACEIERKPVKII